MSEEAKASLETLAHVKPGDTPLNLGNSVENARFHRELIQATALARELLKIPFPSSILDAFIEDLRGLLKYVRRDSGGYTEIRDSAPLFRFLDRTTNGLASVASAFGLVLTKTGDDFLLVKSVRPDDLRSDERLERLENKLEKLGRALSNETVKEISESLVEIRNARSTAAALLKEASKDATTLKVGDYHAFFSKTAETHRAAARKWFRGTVVLALLTLAASVVSVGMAYASPAGRSNELEMTAAKTLTVAVLTSATIWAGLNYRSHRHNAVVNEHRSDALGSFDAFWNAANTKEAKDAVLVQASNAIYLPQQSGFAGKDGSADGTSLGLVAGLISRKG